MAEHMSQQGSGVPEASVGSRTRSAALQRVESQRFDRAEVLEVAGDQCGEEPGYSQPQALESFRPRVAQLPLVAQTGRKSFPQQTGGAGDDLCATGRGGTQPGDPDRDDPLHQLQALFQRLDVLQGFDGRDGHVFHIPSVARRGTPSNRETH